MGINRLKKGEIEKILDSFRQFLYGNNFESNKKDPNIITIYDEGDVNIMLGVRKPSLFRRTINYFKALAEDFERASELYYKSGMNNIERFI